MDYYNSLNHVHKILLAFEDKEMSVIMPFKNIPISYTQ